MKIYQLIDSTPGRKTYKPPTQEHTSPNILMLDLQDIHTIRTLEIK